MSEAPLTPPASAAPPTGRTAEEIKRDPLVAAAVARAEDAVIGAKEFVGEITLTVTRERIRDVAAAFKAEGFNYLVDLSGVTFMDSAGLRALIQVLELRTGKDIVVQSSPQVFTLLHLVGLTDGALPNVVVRPP